MTTFDFKTFFSTGFSTGFRTTLRTALSSGSSFLALRALTEIIAGTGACAGAKSITGGLICSIRANHDSLTFRFIVLGLSGGGGGVSGEVSGEVSGGG